MAGWGVQAAGGRRRARVCALGVVPCVLVWRAWRLQREEGREGGASWEARLGRAAGGAACACCRAARRPCAPPPPCRCRQGLANILWGMGKLGVKVSHEVRQMVDALCREVQAQLTHSRHKGEGRGLLGGRAAAGCRPLAWSVLKGRRPVRLLTRCTRVCRACRQLCPAECVQHAAWNRQHRHRALGAAPCPAVVASCGQATSPASPGAARALHLNSRRPC